MLKKLSLAILPLAALIVAAAPMIASAHVVVSPEKVGVGEFTTYNVAVPVEKDVPTVGLRLEIPGGLNYVQPNVKSGWKIAVKESGTGEEATVTEINWTGGNIPSGQREQFLFAAQSPKEATSLNWKAYQTYADGTVVSWDQKPTGKEGDGSKPYSITEVVNDLASDTATPKNDGTSNDDSNDVNGIVALSLSVVALLVSIGSLLFLKKK